MEQPKLAHLSNVDALVQCILHQPSGCIMGQRVQIVLDPAVRNRAQSNPFQPPIPSSPGWLPPYPGPSWGPLTAQACW